ncbi:MAG TPA: hydroxysqualene dehydroxylase HpnE [Azospira sp.]|nr:hydroxysqualene dehydroxylase HpnE [Azospira sp.]
MAARVAVAVIGGGWAGLACAVELASAGCAVSLYESAKQLGGRARGVEVHGHALDNGQHLLIGAYRDTLDLLQRIGSRHLLQAAPLVLDTPPALRLALPRLPAPLHLAVGLLGARGPGLRDKIAAARFMQALKARHYRLPRDTTVARLLDAHQQHGALRRYLWEPLCLAALNTPAETASAQVFANVLRDSLGGQRQATDMLLPRTDLGRLLPQPAAEYLTQHGGQVRLGCRIRGITSGSEGWQLTLEARQQEEASNGKSSDSAPTFDAVVLATAPQHATALLPDAPALAGLRRQITALRYEPIATCYLGYPETVTLPSPMLGLAGPVGQWVFDRGPMDGQAGVLACVLSAHGPWEELPGDALGLALHREIEAALGRPLPPPLWQQTIREARATFACLPDLERPDNATPLPGLWLAGDYTAGDYPATLEGAVRSGLAAARGILATQR